MKNTKRIQKDRQNINFWNSKESLQRYAGIALFLYDIEWQYVGRAVEKIGKKTEQITILDLGCGGGRTTVPLHNLGFKVVGIDIAENLIDELKKRVPQIPVAVGDASCLDYQTESFDIVIFSHNSLDYLYPYSKRLEALSEISRVTKKGGFFIFSSHVANVIPYSLPIIRNIITNLLMFIFQKKGYCKETMGNGNVVEYYSSSPQDIEKEVNKNHFVVEKYSRVINQRSSALQTYLHSLISWEVYYLCRKI